MVNKTGRYFDGYHTRYWELVDGSALREVISSAVELTIQLNISFETYHRLHKYPPIHFNQSMIVKRFYGTD